MDNDELFSSSLHLVFDNQFEEEKQSQSYLLVFLETTQLPRQFSYVLKLLKISFVPLTSRRLIVMATWQEGRSPDYIITSLRSL